MSEYILNTVQSTLANFDFSYCISINILTYLIIKLFNKHLLSTTKKRIVLVFCIIVLGVVWKLTGDNVRIIVNSAILAPVSWSWFFKPILKHFGLDYQKVNELMDFGL